MKNKLIIIISILLSPCFAFADIELPKKLEGASGVITLKDGTKWRFNSKDYAVVKRKQPKNVSLPVVVTQPRPIVLKSLNRLGIWGGVAMTGIQSSENNGDVTVKDDIRGVIGLSFGHQFEDTPYGYEVIGFGSLTEDNKPKGVLGAGSLQMYF